MVYWGPGAPGPQGPGDPRVPGTPDPTEQLSDHLAIPPTDQRSVRPAIRPTRYPSDQLSDRPAIRLPDIPGHVKSLKRNKRLSLKTNYPGEGSHHICVYRHSCSVVKCSRRGEGITQTESETDD